MPNPSPELLHGTLDALVLKTLGGGRRHGYAVARAIEEATDGVVEIEEGSLYPALYRMERRGWIQGRWVEKAGQRRRRYYRLTAEGRKVLAAQRNSWQEFVEAINRITGIEHA